MKHRRSGGYLLAFILSSLACALPTGALANGFGAGSYPAAVSGEPVGTAVFGTEGGNVACESSTLNASLAEDSARLNVTPGFSKCTAFGFASATVTVGCNFVLRGGEEIASEEFSGVVDIGCEAGKSIQITAGTCAAKIEGQSSLESAKYVNHPGATPPNFTVVASLKKVKYVVTTDGFLCPFKGTGSKEDGTFSGEALMKATSGGSSTSLTLVPHTELCKAQPTAGSPLTCPEGQGFTDQDLAGAGVNGAATWTTSGATISCVSNMTLQLLKSGGSPGAGGITGWTFKGVGSNDCSSDFTGNPAVTTTIENLSYDNSGATYAPGAGSTGTLSVAKAGGTAVQVKFVIHNSGNPTCIYQPTSGLVARWVNGSGVNSSKIEFLNQAFSLTAGPANCPTALGLSGTYSLTRTGGGQIYLAG